MNRTTRPLSEWVTITDEAFLLLCLANYSNVWIHEHIQQYHDGEEVETGAPDPIWMAGCGQGGRKRSWSKKGMNIVNAIMVKVFEDRQEHGEVFDARFMELMKKTYERKQHHSDADDNDHDGESSRRQDTIILSDYNIGSYMAQQQDRHHDDDGTLGDEDDDDDDSNDM